MKALSPTSLGPLSPPDLPKLETAKMFSSDEWFCKENQVHLPYGTPLSNQKDGGCGCTPKRR